MDIITFYCRGEPLTLTRKEIESLTDIDWFLSLLIKYSDNEEKTELGEDIDIVKSIIETLRYNKLVMYNNISLIHMKMLCDKWCVPSWIIEEIESKNRDSIIVDEKIHQCSICRVGFKKSENTKISCQTHRSICGSNEIFFCCNTQTPCNVGYHIPIEEV